MDWEIRRRPGHGTGEDLRGPVPLPVRRPVENCVPQPGTERRLDAQGDKIMAAARLPPRRGIESIVAVHSVNTEAGAGGVRWYEFRVDADRNVKLHQQGHLCPRRLLPLDGQPCHRQARKHRHRLLVRRHAALRRPAVRGPPRQRSARHALAARDDARRGRSARRPTRMPWEDYAQTAMDPRDDCTIWYVGDYFKKGATNYSTRIGAFRMPGCK